MVKITYKARQLTVKNFSNIWKFMLSILILLLFIFTIGESISYAKAVGGKAAKDKASIDKAAGGQAASGQAADDKVDNKKNDGNNKESAKENNSTTDEESYIKYCHNYFYENGITETYIDVKKRKFSNFNYIVGKVKNDVFRDIQNNARNDNDLIKGLLGQIKITDFKDIVEDSKDRDQYEDLYDDEEIVVFGIVKKPDNNYLASPLICRGIKNITLYNTGNYINTEIRVPINNAAVNDFREALNEYDYSIKIPYYFIKNYEGKGGEKESLHGGDIVKIDIKRPSKVLGRDRDYSYYFRIKHMFGWSGITNPIFYALNANTSGKTVNILAPSIASGVKWEFNSTDFPYLSTNLLVSASLSNNSSNKTELKSGSQVQIISFAFGAEVDLGGWLQVGYAYDAFNNYNLILFGVRGVLIDRLFGISE